MKGVTININTLLIAVALLFVVLDYFQTDLKPETIEARTDIDKRNEIELKEIKVQYETLKLAYETDEHIIEVIKDSIVLDSTIIANSDSRVRDSLRAIYNPR